MNARKAVFITGGGSGLGRAMAVKFGNEGWFVGLGDRDEDGMRETERLLPGGYSYAHTFDVRDRAAWDVALKAFATAAGGRIHALANNAGVMLGGPLIESSVEEIDRTLDVNLRGVIYGAQAAHPYLLETAPGSCLLNTASAAGLYGSGGLAVYSASKFGVRAITEALDAEWAADGVTVRDLMPGFIDTPLLKDAINARRNITARDTVISAGLEFTPVETVAQAAFDAVTGTGPLHRVIGKTGRSIAFATRWMPGQMRKRMRKLAAASD